jgi:hypothetical protein
LIGSGQALVPEAEHRLFSKEGLQCLGCRRIKRCGEIQPRYFGPEGRAKWFDLKWQMVLGCNH